MIWLTYEVKWRYFLRSYLLCPLNELYRVTRERKSERFPAYYFLWEAAISESCELQSGS